MSSALSTVSVIIAAALIGNSAAAAAADDSEDDQPPSARHLVQAVIHALPTEPLDISGRLTTRKRHGIVVSRYRFTVHLSLGTVPPFASYTIRDINGNNPETLRITRPAGGKTRIDYAIGYPPRRETPPPLSAHIRNTDLSWLDLTLSFLWWKKCRLIGMETTRGRPCYIVELQNPEIADNLDSHPAPHCVRIWIDTRMHMLLRADALNRQKRHFRKLWIKSFKKINNRWMIKDMEVDDTASPVRTKISVQEVITNTQP